MKPCPFCGGTDIREKIGEENIMGDSYTLQMICWGCGASSGRFYNWEEKRMLTDDEVTEGAIELWNRRK